VLCRDDFVVLVWSGSVDGDRCRLLLRCGQCDTYRDVVVSIELATAFERERMVAEAEAFIVALRHDLIDANDFARPNR
jgi:hypothetical protein